MKKLMMFFLGFIMVSFTVRAQEVFNEAIKEWKIVTVVESIIPMGIGRSRMIENMTEVETDQFRTSRTEGKKSAQNTVRRKDLKVEHFDEAKLLNFFSATGINFQNIASNDAMIGSRIMELEAEGYKMVYVTSAVESYAGVEDDSGLFITRMFFCREYL